VHAYIVILAIAEQSKEKRGEEEEEERGEQGKQGKQSGATYIICVSSHQVFWRQFLNVQRSPKNYKFFYSVTL
jgi:hypothetical protein